MKKTSAPEKQLSKLWLLPLVILILVPVWIFWPREGRPDVTVVPPAETETEKTEESFHSVLTVDAREHFPVYLTGAVYLPGLYYVPDGTILAVVVEEAGGLREEAASEHINLAMLVHAHQMLAFRPGMSSWPIRIWQGWYSRCPVRPRARSTSIRLMNSS